MSAPDTTTMVDDASVRFPSLAALRLAHGELIERRRLQGDTPALLADIAAFIERGVTTGALLDARDDRWASQSLLDYWANVLYRVGLEPPDATLAEFDPQLAPELNDDLCPYLGLDAFHEADHNIFFGRKPLVDELVKRLRERSFLAVVGPSGSGKSSLVRAGLIPVLKAGALPGSQDWRYYPPIVPSSDPLASLARMTQPTGDRSADWIPQQIEGFRQDRSHLAQVIGEAGAGPAVLVVDQFEELFTLCDDEGARLAFIDSLLGLGQAADDRHTVILTLRSDFETFVARVPSLQPLFEQAQVRVTPLSASELREAIEKPAELVGLKFEAGVVDTLLQDILGEPAALPLLQFTMLKLWENRQRNRVTMETYRRIGGGRLALARSADAFYERLIPEEQVTAKRILMRMVRPGEGLEVTSNRIRREALYETGEARDRVDRVLDKLIKARLVRLTEGDAPADDQVEVAHEALVRNWPTLVDWLEEEKGAITMRRRLEAKAAEWVRLGQGSSGLLDEVQLIEAERWLASPEASYLGYNANLPTLIWASRSAIEAAAREEEAARRREIDQARALAEEQQRRAEGQARAAQRLRRLAVALATVFLLAVVAAVVAAINARIATQEQARAVDAQAVAEARRVEAQTARAAAEARQAEAQAARAAAEARQAEAQMAANAGNALFELERRPEQALLLALAALPRDATTYQPVISRALYRVFEGAAIRRLLAKHTKAVKAVAWSPDGRQALTGSDDGTARVWDVATGETLSHLIGHTGGIKAVAWSPDARLVLTGGADKTARIWNVAASATVHTLEGHTAPIRAVAWSPDGRLVLTGSDDGTARIWEAATGQVVRTLERHTAPIRAVAWSPDGRQALTGSEDATARIWDVATGQVVHTLEVEGGGVSFLAAAWSPDGRQVLTAGSDEPARIWDAETGAVVRVLEGHTAGVLAAAWSPDGKQALTGSADTTARVWDVATGAQLQVLKGHQGWVFSVAWSPDGRQVLTGSDDRTARIWNVSSEVVRTLRGHTSLISSVAWSPDGKQALTGSADTTARIWDVATGQVVRALEGHTDVVEAVAWGPDGRLVLTGSADTTARIWDATTGMNLRELTGHQGVVYSVAWSPDGRQMLTGGEDKTARIWDVATGVSVRTLEGHEGSVLSVAWSPDGRQVLTGGVDATARIWDAAAGTLLHTLKGHISYIYFAVWSPDGRQVLTGSADGTARIWDAATGAELRTLKGHEGWVLSVAWSPDGRQVLTGSGDGTARIWDVATGTELRTMKVDTGRIYSTLWSPDGRLVLAGGDDGIARIWLVGNNLIIADVTRRVCDLFDDDQIHQVIPTWRGCQVELAMVASDLAAYDRLRSGK